MKHLLVPGFLAAALSFGASACGPSVKDPGQGDDDDGAGIDGGHGTCNATEANETSCDDGVDSDCDGWADCDDVDCSGVGTCPVCGEASNIEGQPVALPDDGTCANNYTSTINITGFDAGQTLGPASNFKAVCVTMEHSWLRDLQIELSDPRGDIVVLQQFLGQTGSEIYMGSPNDSDDVTPVPGVGAVYCWSPDATTAPMLDYANATGVHDMPPSPPNYQAVSGFGALADTPLNGAWTIKVEDCWGIDNGYIFDWHLTFDDSLVSDCSHPIG